MKSTEETEILERLQRPETREAAFTWVVENYHEKLYWQIRRMVLTHEDADDILQNTFIKAWNGLDNFRGDAQLSTWLYRIALNESLNFLGRKHSTLSLEDENGIVSTLQDDPYFDGDEIQLQLQEAVTKLPNKQRAVFNLKYYEEMTYEEISQIFGTSVGSLKASYHHAVKKITAFFEERD